MKRNLLLVFGLLISLLLVINGTKRILSLRDASKEVVSAQERLEKLKAENEQLKGELEYKKSEEFVEGEIRNKLGLSKKGEGVVVIPKEETGDTQSENRNNDPNWKKWWNLFFGG